MTTPADGRHEGYFEPLGRSAQCAACNNQRPSPSLVDAIYCISVQEEDGRAQQAADHFHAVGLCRDVVFFRPPRGRNLEADIWASHREVARHALARNCDAALILEDDVQFLTDWQTVSRRAARAMARLPDTWWGFFLGHWPMQAYFVAPDVFRTRSACAHAYIASRRLLDWIARSRPLDAAVPALWPGLSIDTAIGNLPEMYALFPMVATQRRPTVYRQNRHVAEDGSRRGWFDFGRHRYWLIHHAMRPAEVFAVLASPLHWAVMRMRGVASGQMGRIETDLSRRAQAIGKAGLFDEAYYLDNAPDVARHPIDPLGHYLAYGDREGRAPHPLFDTGYYRRALGHTLGASENAIVHYLQAEPAGRKDPHPCFDGAWYSAQLAVGPAAGQAPLVHYLQAEGAARKNPHPYFDEQWYLAQYPDVAASGEPALVQYLKRGWKEGRWPHPAFDSRRYLEEYPDTALAGIDPFDHYVRHGRAEGRAPWLIQTFPPLDPR